ncbi:CLUMA_CG009872, isoform A [Clunio marinus]|uniref:CLUMA_CG009872, isoform A n=1 Tax=Clunio marinus TaxID=568069 RepID=A0A1J1I8C8_9DIPT|nr:CLUMA_CG009872, isoform A [Clunio marinus]
MKSNKIAESFNLKASECLAAGKYTEALENYNQSLRFAVNKSQMLSDAYAGRSKIYYEVNQLENCLKNIKKSLQTCINDEKCRKIESLREKCLDQINLSTSEKKENVTSEFFKLSHPQHKRVPFIAGCLEVRENDVYGRYIATTSDLKPGDIVVIEEPFYKVLDPKRRHTRCAICLKQNMLNLFPCVKCSNAMFCSRVCSESVVHRYECNDSKDDSFDKLLLQRMFYQAIEITGSLEELQKLMNRQTSSKTILDFDFSDPKNSMNDKNRILATTSLAEREPWSAEAYAKYESVTQQLQIETEDERKFLQNYLVRCLKSMTVNFFHFFWSPTKIEGQGLALCSLAAYFAHSCDPNVEKIDVDNKFVFITKKPIKAGEQLFMNYDRFSFLTHTLKDRQDYFNKIYTFQCACNACKDDYPMLNKLPRIDEKFIEPETKFESIAVAKLQYQKNCDYISANMDRYPCYEICLLMIQNYRLLHAIGNKLPF